MAAAHAGGVGTYVGTHTRLHSTRASCQARLSWAFSPAPPTTSAIAAPTRPLLFTCQLSCVNFKFCSQLHFFNSNLSLEKTHLFARPPA